MKTVLITPVLPKGKEGTEYTMTYSVMEKFLSDKNLTVEQCNNMTIKELAQEPTSMGLYQHSTTGPAVKLVVNSTGEVKHQEYWFEGKRKIGAEEELYKHNINFNGKVDKLIES